MRLSDLKPAWGRLYRDRHLTPDNGGIPTDGYWLQFICPACGPPFVVTINVGPVQQDDPRQWASSPLPDGPDWPSRVTIRPSIDNTPGGHGRRHPTCSFHGSIINGEIAK